MVCTGLTPAGQLGSRGGATAAGARAVSGGLGERRHAAGVIVDPALRDLEAVGLLAMRAVEINGPAARARDAAAVGVDAGLDLARSPGAQEHQLTHDASPLDGLRSVACRGVPEHRSRAKSPVENVDICRKKCCDRARAVSRAARVLAGAAAA